MIPCGKNSRVFSGSEPGPDNLPYGGAKGSGLGREGPRYAIEEMSEMRLMVINRAGGVE
jgi:acyl-CoA reductase-like NAD-dependent aldehyde dehydrogenase